MPSYVFMGDFAQFEGVLLKYPHRLKFCHQMEFVRPPGISTDRIYYIQSGVVQCCIDHDSGNRKTISFYGPGGIFPGYHRGHYQLEDAMLYIALGDVAVLEYSGEQFGEILNENHDISTQLIDWYVAYSNLLLFDAAHQKFNDAFKKLCNLLYLLVANENDFQKLIGGITQNMLAEILGVSQGTVTNGLARLREEEIIKTERKQIVIRDIAALAGYCSYEIL